MAEKMFGMFDNASICWSNVDAENIATISPLEGLVSYPSANGYDDFAQYGSALTRSRQCKVYGSGSFLAVHYIVQDEVSACGIWSVQESPQERFSVGGRPNKPDGPAIGEAKLPIGDVLLPMLLCTAMCIVVRHWRIWKLVRKTKM